MDFIRPLDEIAEYESSVGGKALGLARLIRAGLPVPPGFVITTEATQRLEEVTGEVLGAFRGLGGPVAVRSSATMEDGATASYAGLHESTLGVREERAFLEALARCRAALDAPGVWEYRQRQGARQVPVGMAVVVQRLVQAEVAGVLFTQDPLDVTGRHMLVEASWGFGTSIVSGRVTPDRFQVRRDSGAVVDRQIGNKATQSTPLGTVPVPAEGLDRACLDDAQLVELANLGQRVETIIGSACDIEWSWAGGQFWLLQARPITTVSAAEREQVRREEITCLAAKTEPGGTVWSRYNLAETLPAPTPMSWSVVRRLLSGGGGLGCAYRDLGCNPDPALDDETVYDLICGRPYCNLSREPRLQFHGLPLRHAFAALKALPQDAIYPQPSLDPAALDRQAWLALPWTLFRLGRANARVDKLARTFADQFRQTIVPAFKAWLGRETEPGLGDLSAAELTKRLERLINGTLVDFARDALKPTVLAAVARGRLEQALKPALGPGTSAVMGELSLHISPDADTDLARAFDDLAGGRLTRDEFLKHFGHRGGEEMELAQPRWRETREFEMPAAAHACPAADLDGVWQRIASAANLKTLTARTDWERLRTYLALRETAKHYLMMGYAAIRDVLVELDRRHGLAGGIFYLTLEQLPQLIAGADLSAEIAGRRRRRNTVLSIDVPPVLFSDDLDAIGRPVPVVGAAALQGVPLSAGVAEGPALVIEKPAEAGTIHAGFILVCPSTDPAWIPLFAQARGLVMETGGVLSHGAIVAREFGLPAVAGPPGVQRALRSGQRLRVDGGAGTVTLLDE